MFFRPAVRRQVQRQAAPVLGLTRSIGAVPQFGVQEDAVNEQR
jgi:hypothetical protein